MNDKITEIIKTLTLCINWETVPLEGDWLFINEHVGELLLLKVIPF